MNFKKIISVLIPFLLLVTFMSAQTTIVKGIVKDENNEPLGFADVLFTNSYNGLSAEWDGTFELSTDDLSLDSLTVGFLGYDSKTIAIKSGIEQSVEIALDPTGIVGTTVIITRVRPKKDTAAIMLFRRVVKAKEKLRESEYDSYQYEDYTKMEFDVFNVKEKFKKRKILKPFDFVFENMDTTENGTPFLPVLLKEKISEVYYQKNPKKEKEIVKADQFSGIDNKEFYSLTDYSFPDIDIYDKTVLLGTKAFVNPFSKGALGFYKYFLEDSMMIDNKFCYKLQFTPKRKSDLAFTGDAWIDKETAMIKSLEILVLEQINVNFLTGLEIRQDFDDVGNGNWFKSYERMKVLMNISENKEKQAIRVVKTTTHKNIIVNEPIDPSILEGDDLKIDELAYKRTAEFWTGARHDELSETESAIYTTMEKVQKTKAYKLYNYLGNTASSGFFNAGKIEFGRFFQFYSFNGLEGNRFRMGIRTSPKHFRDKFAIGAYAAYGTKDKLLKYHLGANMHLKRTNNKWHMIGGYYRYDWSDYNFKNPYMSHDHILSSLLRGRNNLLTDLFLIREGYLFYEKEWIKGLTNKFSFRHKTVYSWEDSNFDIRNEMGNTIDEQFEVAEFGFHTTYGPKQVFLNRQGGSSRQAVDINGPVLDFDYVAGVKGFLGGDHTYHNLKLELKHKITSRVGQTYYFVTAAKIFGDIPSPLLTIHKGNNTYLYNKFAFNMMDDLEFANDAYVGLEARHFFDGFIMNAIPGVRRLKLRTMFYGKAIYGGVSDKNKALLTEQSPNLQPLEGPYAEVGVGILNILKVIQIYGFYRVTPHDPGASTLSKFGFKFDIGVSL
ncbi:MAG: hypothetical protein ACI94Y_003383 [Maribacter sp.]|jgi:hypothetical protein